MDYYIERDIQGKIIAVYASEQFPNQEILSDNSTEINEFLNPTLTIEQIKKTKEAEINTLRDYKKYNGGVEVDGKWFLSTQSAALEYTAIITTALAAGIPDNMVVRSNWRTMVEGKTVDMTPALAKQIMLAGITKVGAIDTVAQGHKVVMRASAHPGNYDYSTGWPEVFPG